MKPVLFTIGHSGHPVEEFLSLLEQHNVNVVCDVRSRPYSQFAPQFNRETMQVWMRRAGIKYLFMGDLLGARSQRPECYEDGRVRYDLLAAMPEFRAGIDRLRRGVQEHRIALMCAEKDPMTCHRAILIGAHLRKEMTLMHIREDGVLEGQKAMEDRMLASVGLSREDLFISEEDQVVEAYRRQGQLIAYQVDESQHVPMAMG